MPPNLEEKFIAANGGPVSVGGRVIHWWFDLPPVAELTKLLIQLVADSARPQGLCLRAQGGQLLVNDQTIEGSDVILWSDIAPPEVNVGLRPTSATPMSLRMWNVWRVPGGMMPDTPLRWMGDAGMLVGTDREGSVVTLRCSDSFSPPTFDDLVVRIQVICQE